MKLSVIVPVYNVEHYLPACLNSILPVLENEDELFLIQGKSTDQSRRISLHYQSSYPQIQVLDQNGRGLSNARNCGLHAASGDLILFIDSDDFVETATLQTLLKQLRELERLPDVVMTDFFRCYETIGIKQRMDQIGQRSMKGLDALPAILKGHTCFWNVWRNLYRRDFLVEKQLLFRENTYAEDVDYMTRVFLAKPELWMVDAPFYCYRIGRGGSLMNETSLTRIKQTEEILEESIQRLREVHAIWSQAILSGFQFEYILNLALIQELLANLAVYGAAVKDGAYPIYLFGSVGTGDAKACIIVTVFVAALFAIMWALISRSFLKTATATGKTARTVYRETTVRQKSIPAALLGREFAHFGASPNYMLNCGLGTFLMPVCALLILWKGGEFLSTVETLLDGLEGSVPVMLSICLCGVASMNDMTAPSVSLEGRSLWLMQSLPVTPWQVLKAKLSMQIILTAVPMALCIVCAAAVYPFLPVQLLMMTLLVMSYVVLMALFGLFLGVKNPILTWTNEISPIKQSAPVMIALFGSFGYTILLFVGYVALPGWKLGFFGYMGCLAGLNLILCALLYLWLKKKGSARFAEL